MFSQIGVPGIILLVVICILVFGTKNLPNIGKSLGSSLREFKQSINSENNTLEYDSKEGEKKHE